MACNHSSDFLFVTYTEQPEKASKRTLRAVRKHVMDDYFRRQKGKDPRKHHTTAGVDRILQAKGDSGRSSIASWTHSTEPCQQQYSPPNVPESCTSYSSGVFDRQWYASHESSPLSLSLSPQRIDPFDVLPLSGTIDQDELIRWISYRDDTRNWELAVPWLHSDDSIYSKALWSASMDNRGLFHIMLSVGQSRRAIVRRQHDISTSLYHHGQALQCLRQRMAAQDYSGATLMLVCCLARINLQDEDPTPAIYHMKAVQQFVGPDFPALNDIQWRAIVWTDLRLASTLLQDPFLPYNSRRRGYIRPELQRQARLRTVQTMNLVPKTMPDETRQLFEGLHLESAAYTTSFLRHETQWPMQDVPYHVVYRLCVLLSEGARYSLTTPQAVLLAMQVYAWTCVPEYIPEQTMVRVCYVAFMKRVSEQALSRLHEGLYKAEELIRWWRDENGSNLESLLWVLFVAWGIARMACTNQYNVSMSEHHAEGWFLERLQEVCLELGLASKEEFEAALKRFPWVDHFCAESCEEAWKKMSFDEAQYEMGHSSGFAMFLLTDRVLSDESGEIRGQRT